mgnify:CR=1 FL=1
MNKIILMIITVFITSSIFAEIDNFENSPRKEKIAKYLNLTAEQEKKIDELNYNMKKVAIDLRSKIQKNRLELKKLIDDGNIDEKKILQLIDENNKLQGELKSNRMKNWLDIYKVLDKEQQQKWFKAFQKFTDSGFIKNRMREKIEKFKHFRMR